MGRLREWNNGLELQSLYSEQALCAVSCHGLPKPTSRLIISHKDRDHVWMDCVLATSVCAIDHLRPKSRIAQNCRDFVIPTRLCTHRFKKLRSTPRK